MLDNKIQTFAVFTLQSIKSRIETWRCEMIIKTKRGFLLYSPLNQGLKQDYNAYTSKRSQRFYSTVH